MADILVRNISQESLNVLKKRARAKGRSLQAELRSIIEEAAGESVLEGIDLATRIRRSLQAKGKNYSDSVELIREDRER